MKRCSNIKGFTLLEMMIVVAIVGILSSFGVISTRGRAEKQALKSMSTKIPLFLGNIRDRSFDTGTRYYLEFKLSENKIYILKNENDDLDDNFKVLTLSDNLIYEKKDETQDFSIESTPKGNFSKNLSIVIFDKKREDILKKISIWISRAKIDYAKITVYNPKPSINIGNYTESYTWEKQ